MLPPTFLFSIDLEDVRMMIESGERFAERVPAMTERYLEFLRKHNSKATFFVVGQTARKHPSLIRSILAEGHELACHTDLHTPLTQLCPDKLRDDLSRNLEALAAAGGSNILGFRAPILSLVKETAWAYDVLAEFGFTYSSSVLPAKNPLFGWPDFGANPRRISSILEIPVTLPASLPPRVPFGAGTYFRILPWALVRRNFSAASRAGRPVVGYFHPYDIDTEQERFMHPGINDSRLFNSLMYVGRSRVMPRLERIMSLGWRIQPYREFIQGVAA